MKITELEPKLVWECFDEITKVPRPTHHLDKMRDFLVKWAERHNIDVATDAVGNVRMSVPATPGHENAVGVILQGHQDMVAEKIPSSKHDFYNDPIETIVDGEWVRANGTTLGADNGMGCASAMAVLIDPTVTHGPIEALFTVDEEQGLIGANGLEAGFVKGDILLNLDSEEMGQLVIGCAGGKVTECRLALNMLPAPEGVVFYKVEIGGLKGGHSGMEIGLGRANANQQLARFLWQHEKELGWIMAKFDGGGLANAIPRDAYAIIGVAPAKVETLTKLVAEFENILNTEFKGIENQIHFTAEQVDVQENVIDTDEASRLVSAVFCAPNGVQQMSASIEGLIETSCNLASVKMTDNEVLITVHQRSSVDSRRDEIADRIAALFSMIGGDVKFDDAYVGWAPNTESKVLHVAKASYEKLFGGEPKVEALHAGLECGLFLEKMPNLDMVSFGPTLKDIHSPGEKVNIKSVGEFYALLKDILATLAQTPRS